MKKTLYIILVLICTVALLVAVFGCTKTQSEEPETPSAYTIQYTDAAGSHTITVQHGMPYSLESIPEKAGYIFQGLYDSKVGGTQYVDEEGTSLSVFTDKKNLVLFPQFKAKEYTIALDYQGAAVVGSRQFKVEFAADLPELPKNLSLENKVFLGWWTEPNRGGTQIADEYGNLPLVSTLTEDTFDLSGAAITLYAGFMGAQYTVTFNADGKTEERKVEHGTPISSVVPDIRKDGMAPLSWSKSQNGEEAFTGNVTSDMILYATEWAPVLAFDAAGGNAVSPLVAKAGTTIALPTPTRMDYTFAGWYTTGGVAFSTVQMPASSANLVAHWNAQLIFDARGGSDVATISEAKGTAIVLPTTEKADYIFAGWYTEAGEKYEATAMPESSLRLQAKYYKIEHAKYVLIDATTTRRNWSTVPRLENADYYNTLDLSELYEKGVRNIRLTVSYDDSSSASTASRQYETYMKWYSQLSTSDAYLVWSYGEKHTNSATATYTRSTDITLTSAKLYVCNYASTTEGVCYWTNFWADVEYPDMSTLY